MQKLIVEPKFNNKKLSTFMYAHFNGLTSSTFYKTLRKKDIRINDVRVNEDKIVHEFDTITIFIVDELLYKNYDIKTIFEDEDTLLSCAIDGMYLNSELFSHFRGSSNIGYLKVKKNDLILSAQNLHLGNCNVNLRFEHGIISPAYKVYELVGCNPLFMQAWVKKDSTKDFFSKSSTEGASVCRKNIVWEELYKQELPVPSIDEQTKVGEYFYSLDHLITLHQRQHKLHLNALL